MNANADLSYGIVFDDEDNEIMNNIYTDDIIDKLGYEPPHPENWKNRDTDPDYDRKRIENYDHRNKWVEENLQLETGWFGYIDGASNFLRHKNLGACADWSEPTYLKEMVLKPHPETHDHFKEICDLLGVKYSEPRWFLTANYG